MATIDQVRPDVLLLDLLMPGVSGFEILTHVRAESSWQHIPVIVLTASTDAPTRLPALELGATAILSKPVDASELALRIKNALSLEA